MKVHPSLAIRDIPMWSDEALSCFPLDEDETMERLKSSLSSTGMNRDSSIPLALLLIAQGSRNDWTRTTEPQ
jgi:hypothetical protein